MMELKKKSLRKIMETFFIKLGLTRLPTTGDMRLRWKEIRLPKKGPSKKTKIK